MSFLTKRNRYKSQFCQIRTEINNAVNVYRIIFIECFLLTYRKLSAVILMKEGYSLVLALSELEPEEP